MKQTHSSVLMMRNPGSSSRRSSDTVTRASSSKGHPDRSHALSVADLLQEWNFWQDTFPPRARIGEPHSECSDVSSELKEVALIDLGLLGNHRTILDRDCQHAQLSKDMAETRRSSFSISLHEYDDRHITKADLPFATIGVFHIHPSISHGAAREDLQNEIMPLVTLYRCDAITGDANKSANTYSKLQHVFNPANGLVNILMRAYQRLWNETFHGMDFVHPKIHCPSSPVHEVWIRR